MAIFTISHSRLVYPAPFTWTKNEGVLTISKQTCKTIAAAPLRPPPSALFNAAPKSNCVKWGSARYSHQCLLFSHFKQSLINQGTNSINRIQYYFQAQDRVERKGEQ